jgi:hypothetical protein
MKRLSIFVLPLALVCACEQPPEETVEDNGGPPPLCDQCHKLKELQAPGATGAPAEHMRKAGLGLVRVMELMASDKMQYTFGFQERGNHPNYTLNQCSICHPVSAEGVRHGLSQYPPASRAKAFKPETCAPSCHSWLGTSVTSSGFTPKSGAAPTYAGSLRPGDLLAAASDGHALLFKKGYSKSAARVNRGIKVGRILTGCVGCHNTQTDKHGETPACLYCHTMGGSSGKLHGRHVSAITAGRAALDPGNAAASSCDYCHGFSSSTTTLKNAACYSCHLSGHQVMNPKTGKPHFWGP